LIFVKVLKRSLGKDIMRFENEKDVNDERCTSCNETMYIFSKCSVMFGSFDLYESYIHRAWVFQAFTSTQLCWNVARKAEKVKKKL
jgi:hypothetical protein